MKIKSANEKDLLIRLLEKERKETEEYRYKAMHGIGPEGYNTDPNIDEEKIEVINSLIDRIRHDFKA